MPTSKIQQLGGQATARILRELALERYYNNPNVCLFCNKIIEVLSGTKAMDTRKKKFCDRSCACSYNNTTRRKEADPSRMIKCSYCGKEERRNSNRKYCKECWTSKVFILNKTKGELFSARKNWQSARSEIRRHAAFVFSKSGLPQKCQVCGYSRHIEICHKKPVKAFAKAATIGEINHISNLIGLCGTHHWEFDNGFLEELK